MFLWRCHNDVFYVVIQAFHRYYLFCLERQNMFGNNFIFGMSSVNFFWNISLTNQNLCFLTCLKIAFWMLPYVRIVVECFFYLNPKYSLQISLSWFSCKKKRTFQCIHFTTVSIFSISLIRYDSLDGDQLQRKILQE